MTRTLCAITVAAVVALAGCASQPGEDIAGNSISAAPSDPAEAEDGVPTLEATDTAPAVETFRIGQLATVNTDGAVSGTITVQGRSARKNSKSSFDPQKPENGLYVIVTLTAKATGSGTFDINPFDFYLVDPEGNRYEPGAGNSLYEPESERMLNATTLNPGEQVKGVLLFDAPASAAVLNYAPLGQALCRWTLG